METITRDQRTGTRRPLKFPVFIHEQAGVPSKLYLATNLSLGGLLLHADKGDYGIGDKLYVEMSLPLSMISRRIRAIARVAWQGEDGTLGVNFESIRHTDSSFLENYISRVNQVSSPEPAQSFL